MPNPYAALLRVPGGPAFSGAAFVARLPISMIGIALVLLVSATTHRYGLAGAVAAVSALSEALGQPLLSRYVDRYGQARAVWPMVAVSSAATALLAWLVTSGAPTWTLFPAAVVGGAAWPNVGALVRARWSAALPGSPHLQTAYSFESVVDEVIFVVGPPLVTWVAVSVGAAEALLTTVVLLLVGSALFLVQRRTEPARAPAASRDGPSALSVGGIRIVFVMLVALGGVFGSFEVVTVAFTQAAGHPGALGVIIALNAAGSMVAGIVYGAVRPSGAPYRQLVALGLVVPVTVVAFPFVHSLVGLGVLAFLSGLVIAPTLIAAFRLVELMSPPGRLTEGLTLTSTGIVLGVALSAAVAGRVVDQVGAPEAYAVTAAAGLLTGLVAVVGARFLHAEGAQGRTVGGDTGSAGRQ